MKQLLIFLSITTIGYGQTTLIPDPNFEQALINQGLDDIVDGSVLTANISGLTYASFTSYNIVNLAGIEDFALLDTLKVVGNDLDFIDLSSNTSLKYLDCNDNPLQFGLNLNNLDELWFLDLFNCSQLSSIDLSTNIALKNLYFENTPWLTSLDLSNNLQLEILIGSNSALTELDLSNNAAIQTVNCLGNYLNCLNLKNGNNANIQAIDATFNFSLLCIEVDDTAYSNANWSNSNFEFEAQSLFSTNCNNSCSSLNTGIVEVMNSNLTIYPNPTSDQITIDIKGYSGVVNFAVYDLQGKLLETTTNTIVSLKKHAKGIYVLKVSYGEVTEEVRVVRE